MARFIWIPNYEGFIRLCVDLGIDVVIQIATFGGERIPDNILCCTQRPSSEILPDNLFGKTAAF